MLALDFDFCHHVGHRSLSVSGQAVDVSANEKVGSGFLGCAEQLIDIALAVAHMHVSLRIAQKRRRLAEVVNPANALLLLDGDAGRVDPLFERVASLELLPRLELGRGDAQRQSL